MTSPMALAENKTRRLFHSVIHILLIILLLEMKGNSKAVFWRGGIEEGI